MNDEYMTTNDVAELCRTPVETVRYWRHIGYGPVSFKAGRRVLYRRTDVDDWLAQLRDSEISDRSSGENVKSAARTYPIGPNGGISDE